MTLFLFLKQIVDLLYQYHSLDYMMVLFMVLLLVYQFALVRPNIKETFTLTDGVVMALGVLSTVVLFRDLPSYGTYFKFMSALFLYFMGRIYYDRIKECTGALVAGGYIVVYMNLFSRFWRYGFSMIGIANADGDLYFYDTDMAFAMILAMVFIVMYGHNTVFKYITVFLVCPIMVFCSDAGIQMVLMLAVYVIIGIYIMELVLENKKISNIILAVAILGLLAIVCVIYLPVFGDVDSDFILTMFGSRFLDNDNMYGRYEVWRSVLLDITRRSALERATGMGFASNSNIGSLYMKLLYSLGYLGAILGFAFIVNVVYYVIKVEDRKTFFVTTIQLVMLLGTGVTVCSMESTQMSWFPMMFAGMVVSSVQAQDEKEKIEL